jgi:hypothetical protein
VAGQLLYDSRDVIKALWDKAWRESEETENVYVDNTSGERLWKTFISARESSENI